MIVSQYLTLSSSVPPKLPSMIHESPPANSVTFFNHSSFEDSVHPGFQKNLSRCLTSILSNWPNCLAKVDFPAPPGPITRTLFISSTLNFHDHSKPEEVATPVGRKCETLSHAIQVRRVEPRTSAHHARITAAPLRFHPHHRRDSRVGIRLHTTP